MNFEAHQNSNIVNMDLRLPYGNVS